MFFGGLYTDVAEDTIYIMKDFLQMSLGEAPPIEASTQRLEWSDQWPAWRFDHSMIIAPRVIEQLPGGGQRVLTNAPVLYGGGGGMDIFEDVWVYDVRERAWSPLGTAGAHPTASQVITSLLFGTVGLVMFIGLALCALMRKLTHRRFGGADALGRAGGPGGSPVDSVPPRPRGVHPAVIEALPRSRWGETEKAKECKEAKREAKAATAAAAAAAESTTAATPGAAVVADSSGTRSGSSSCSSSGADGGADGGAERPNRKAATSSASSPGGAAAAAEAAAEDVDVEAGGGGRPCADAAAGDATEEMATATFRSSDGDSESDDMCPVCLCAYDDDDVVLELPCAHVFHEACIGRWLQQESSCPQCRFQLVPAPPRRDSGRAADEAIEEGGTELVELPAHEQGGSRPSGRANPSIDEGHDWSRRSAEDAWLAAAASQAAWLARAEAAAASSRSSMRMTRRRSRRSPSARRTCERARRRRVSI